MFSQKGFGFIFLILLIPVILGLMAGSYYFGTKQIDSSSKVVQASSKPSQFSSPAVKITKYPSDIPSDWKKEAGKNCQSTFYIPPKKEPFYHPYKPYNERKNPSVGSLDGSGSFWDFPRGIIGAILIPIIEPNGKYLQDPTMYTSEDATSGEVIAGVFVSCLGTNLKTNLELQNLLNPNIDKFNTGAISRPEGMAADSWTINKVENIKKWGLDVLKINLSENFKNSGGEPFSRVHDNYLFIHNQKVYEAVMIRSENDSILFETAGKIFDNLAFE